MKLSNIFHFPPLLDRVPKRQREEAYRWVSQSLSLGVLSTSHAWTLSHYGAARLGALQAITDTLKSHSVTPDRLDITAQVLGCILSGLDFKTLQSLGPGVSQVVQETFARCADGLSQLMPQEVAKSSLVTAPSACFLQAVAKSCRQGSWTEEPSSLFFAAALGYAEQQALTLRSPDTSCTGHASPILSFKGASQTFEREEGQEGQEADLLMQASLQDLQIFGKDLELSLNASLDPLQGHLDPLDMPIAADSGHDNSIFHLKPLLPLSAHSRALWHLCYPDLTPIPSSFLTADQLLALEPHQIDLRSVLNAHATFLFKALPLDESAFDWESCFLNLHSFLSQQVSDASWIPLYGEWLAASISRQVLANAQAKAQQTHQGRTDLALRLSRLSYRFCFYLKTRPSQLWLLQALSQPGRNALWLGPLARHWQTQFKAQPAWLLACFQAPLFHESAKQGVLGLAHQQI